MATQESRRDRDPVGQRAKPHAGGDHERDEEHRGQQDGGPRGPDHRAQLATGQDTDPATRVVQRARRRVEPRVTSSEVGQPAQAEQREADPPGESRALEARRDPRAARRPRRGRPPGRRIVRRRGHGETLGHDAAGRAERVGLGESARTPRTERIRTHRSLSWRLQKVSPREAGPGFAVARARPALAGRFLCCAVATTIQLTEQGFAPPPLS